MEKIDLTQGKVALIDDKNFERLNQDKWYANTYYAQRNITIRSKNIKSKREKIYMHREIIEKKLNRKLRGNEEIHHINGNGLDNREKNLQVVTNSQHKMLGKKRQIYNNKITSSKHKGVSWNKRKKQWQVHITLNGKLKNLGYFNNEIDAALAYDKKAKELFGEFARLNFS